MAVWGCGPVGQFAIQSAYLLGADRVIAIDRVPERLWMAQQYGKAETINFEDDDVQDRLRTMTGGRGPDACIDAVGLEAHGSGSVGARYDAVKTSLYLATDRLDVLRQAIHACKKGGTVSIPGVYGGFLDKVPMGAAFAKGLTFRMGQTHVHKYMPRLLTIIEEGGIDPSFVISHHVPLDEAKHITDDERIAEAVGRFGGVVRMTDPAHRTGTDRIAEVARALPCEVVVNVQGDEPLVSPSMIEDVIAPFDDPAVDMTTARRAIDDPADLEAEGAAAE